MWNINNIPEHETENILDLYWQILRDLESKHPNDMYIQQVIVHAAYTVLNRCGITDLRPRNERGEKGYGCICKPLL